MTLSILPNVMNKSKTSVARFNGTSPCLRFVAYHAKYCWEWTWRGILYPMKTKPLLITIGCIAVIAVLLSWNRIFPQKPVVIPDPSTLPGIQTGQAPWSPEIPNLRTRLQLLGLPALAAEGNVLHIHQHLDLVIDGATSTPPAGIGINEGAGFISPLHTHDTSGIIHVESNVVRDFTLGEFFDIWGVLLTKDCIGGYCADATHTLKVYSNGNLISGNPRDLVLSPHQEIMVVYGNASSTPSIVSSYTFPVGY